MLYSSLIHANAHKQVRSQHIEVSMIRRYHNHKPQTNTQHREEEPKNTDCHKA